MPTPFPPAAPTISGSALTLDVFLNNPPLVQKMVSDLTYQRFFADAIFREGPRTDAGAVLYDQIVSGFFFTDRDVQDIAPGSEFPEVGAGQQLPLVAKVAKYGGKTSFTREAIRRDRRDLLGLGMARLANTIVRKNDQKALTALRAAPINTASASASWGTSTTDIITDLETARSTIWNADLGYDAFDLAVIIHPTQRLGILKNAGIRGALPRERMDQNLIGPQSADLGNLLNFRWYVSNQQTAGTVDVVAMKVAGAISEEEPTSSEVVPIPRQQKTEVMGWRIAVPYVTDPKAVVEITGA